MLADHHLDRGFQLAQDLFAELEFLGLTELRQVSSEQHEVGLRIQSVDILNSTHGRFDESFVQLALVQMRVRNIGEAKERLLLRLSANDIHQLEGMWRHGGFGRCDCCRHAGDFQKLPTVQVLDRPEKLRAFSTILFFPFFPFQWPHNRLRGVTGYLLRVIGKRSTPNDESFSSPRASRRTRSLVRVLRNSSRSLISCSVRLRGMIPPSRLGFGSPPLL